LNENFKIARMNVNRKIFIYIACSLDGFIAGEGDDLAFLRSVEKEGEDYGYAAFLSQIDTMIVGRRTYDKVQSMNFPYPPKGKKMWVVTNRVLDTDSTQVETYSGDLRELIIKLKSESGKHIFVDGGAQIVKALLNQSLVDELIVSIVPQFVGKGIRLFNEIENRSKWRLLNCQTFETGLVQLHYQVQ
jgi:dihydrofolate reductase